MTQPQLPRDAEGADPAGFVYPENFFSSGLRSRIDQLMNTLWAGGVNNPMESIEQLSYLVFLRLLSERDDQASAIEPGYQRVFAGAWARFAWPSFVTLTGDELFDALRAAIERLSDLPGLTSTGRELFRNATLKIYDRPTLRSVVQIVNTLDLAPRDGRDLKGDMYEYLLSKLAQSGTNGQFRTPRHVVDLIVRMVDPKPGQRICDPACGTAGFLISAYRHIVEGHSSAASVAAGNADGDQLSTAEWEFLDREAFTGFDNDANMVKIAILNLYLHQLERARVEHRNPLTSKDGGTYPGMRYDAILANPPFAGRIQRESILSDLGLDTRDTELLFLKWFIDHLAPGGRAGVIVPNGVLFGSGRADRRVRELLMTQRKLEAVVSLPSGVFKPYSGVGTAILVFSSNGPTDEVWFYEVTADGLSLDDRRVSTTRNDLPDVLRRWPAREEGPNSFTVGVDRIKANDWQLTPSQYRQRATTPDALREPHEILADILTGEEAILAEVRALIQRMPRD